MKAIARVILCLLAIVFTVAAIAVFANPPTENLGAVFAVQAVLAALCWYAYWKLSSGRAAAPSAAASKIDAQVDAARDWLEVAAAAPISPASTGPVIVPKNQWAVLSERSTYHEYRSANTRAYVGTRIKIGKLPLYLGSAQTLPHTVLRPISDGQLVLTTKAILFVGEGRTASIDLEDLLSVEPTPDFIIVAPRTRSKPHIFSVSNPVLWAVAARAIAEGKLNPVRTSTVSSVTPELNKRS